MRKSYSKVFESSVALNLLRVAKLGAPSYAHNTIHRNLQQ
jgi:hypothetical protein